MKEFKTVKKKGFNILFWSVNENLHSPGLYLTFITLIIQLQKTLTFNMHEKC